MFTNKYTPAIAGAIKVGIFTAAAQATAVLSLGITPLMSAIVVALAIIQLPITVMVVGRAWPDLDKGWNLTRFWAGVLLFTRMGYERAGINQIPWNLIINGNLAIGFIMGVSQSILQPETPYYVWVVATLVLTPVLVLVQYGVGYLFGGKRQASLAVA